MVNPIESLLRRNPKLDRLALNLEAIRTFRRAGLLHPAMLRAMVQGMGKWGPSLASGYAGHATRDPYAVAVVDEHGSLTFREVDDLSNAIAHVLADHGIEGGVPVALMARNSRWFVLATAALDKLGATTLYMNTGFAGPQLADVMAREGAALLLHDDEFTAAVREHAPDCHHLVLDVEGAHDDLDDVPTLLASAVQAPPEKPTKLGKQVILTSGTTGVPKGAARGRESDSIDVVAAAALFERVPFRAGDVHCIPAPMFHSLGNAALLASAQLAATVVTARRFDPEETLAQIEAHRCRSMTVVPVMLQRILALGEDVAAKYDTSSLEVILCSGSALPGSLAVQWMDRFGDNLYNMYGSTEVSAATIATPEDMRAAPGTAGRPLSGVDVRLYDDSDRVVTTPGEIGRIFVGSTLRFEGYTGGQTKPSIDGLLSSGDLGHWDDDGRLFVGGRDDDMIVSGGENLFPREVEDLVADMGGIREVAVIGVDDDEFGKRLAAFVVLDDGASLTVDDIKAHVKANLANFKVPRDVTFLDALPRNATGKVLKRDLRELV